MPKFNPQMFISSITKCADEAFYATTLDECPYVFLIDDRFYDNLINSPVIGVHYMYGGDLSPDAARVAFKPYKDIDHEQQVLFHTTFNNLMGEIDESEWYN